MSTPVFIVDIIGDVISKASTSLLTTLQAIDPLITGINYEYGHINDIRERITEKTAANQKVAPFICLIEDFRIKKGSEGLTGITDMKLIILYYGKPDITRAQRESTVFRPILYPIYNEFLKQLKLSGKFMIYDESTIQHDMIARPHWGDPALYGNKQYPLNGVFDGIEIANLSLTTFLNNCQ